MEREVSHGDERILIPRQYFEGIHHHLNRKGSIQKKSFITYERDILIQTMKRLDKLDA